MGKREFEDALVALGAYKERRRIRRAQSRALAHLKAHAQHIECASCVGDAVTIDEATRVPRKAPKTRRAR